MRDIVSIVLDRAAQDPERLCVRTFSRRVSEATRTVAEVAAAAGRAACFYLEHGLKPGDPVVLIGTHHIDFYAAWLGCVWVGGVPSVLAEPSVRVAPEVYWARMAELLRGISAWGAVLDPRVKINRELFVGDHVYRYDELPQATGAAPALITPAPESTLLLQHSSGTTGLHKGVMLSHEAVARHAASYQAVLRMTPDDVIASWLPLYHDMGFIACFVDSLLWGAPIVWLSPFEWVANPALLLEAITRYRATLTWLPNFAFKFLAQRVKAAPGTFDLRSLRAIVNCSEPVTHDSMAAFAERFASDGFAPQALQACYAMAENVFAVTSSHADCPLRERRVSRSAWRDRHIAEPATTEANSAVADSVVHLSNGVCVPGCEVRVVDAAGQSLPPNHAGDLWVRSNFLFSGYYKRDDLNGNLFRGEGFFDTGDLGYMDEDGHVYVTGRKKDMIIVGGKNIYPQDVELVVGEMPGVYPGRVVCFGVVQRDLGTEGLVVLLESESDEAEWPQIAASARLAGPARLDVDIIDVRIIPRGTLRKSSSGKLARAGNREWYFEGRFGPPPDGVIQGET